MYSCISFQCYKCYDLIPTSAKLVILDTELILKQVSSSQRNQIFRITNENVYLVDCEKISGIFCDGGHRGPSLPTLGFSKAKICRHANHHRFHKVFSRDCFHIYFSLGVFKIDGWKPPMRARSGLPDLFHSKFQILAYCRKGSMRHLYLHLNFPIFGILQQTFNLENHAPKLQYYHVLQQG